MNLVMKKSPCIAGGAAVPRDKPSRVGNDTSLHFGARQEGKPEFLNVWSKTVRQILPRQRCHDRSHLGTDRSKEA
ncbi:MAG TPA: hypothetical protein VHZ56_06590, partial [Devosia sp.]|nr:hypothetical protein [Devosia sp.]